MQLATWGQLHERQKYHPNLYEKTWANYISMELLHETKSCYCPKHDNILFKQINPKNSLDCENVPNGKRTPNSAARR